MEVIVPVMLVVCVVLPQGIDPLMVKLLPDRVPVKL